MKIKENNIIDYNNYVMSKKDILEVIGEFLIIDGMISYIFFDSFIAFVFLLPFVILLYLSKKKSKKIQRLNSINLEFKELLVSLTTSLNAGYSLENSFVCALEDIKVIYNKETYIEKEIEIIIKKISMNIPVEDVIFDLAKRTNIEDINNFAQVVNIAKRNGGNLIKIMEQAVDNISEKVESEVEIATMIAGKKLEQQIMCIIPFAIIAYLRLTNGDYIESLYHNSVGIIIMTIAIVITILMNIWAKKIVSIKV